MKLLCRFYDPTEGNIFIDNHNLKDLQIESLQQITALCARITDNKKEEK
jgi:ABC-type multidrug transport system fused ATPase/permease subunit